MPTKTYSFEITNPDDGDFWANLCSTGCKFSVELSVNRWTEITIVVPEGTKVTWRWQTSFESWLEDVMGEDPTVFEV